TQSFIMNKLLVALFAIALIAISAPGYAQNRGSIGVSLDSLAKLERNADSLVKLDEKRRKQANPTELATYREIDLTNDGKPEALRLYGKVLPEVNKIKFDFTVRSGSKLLYRDSWTADGYFDPADNLNDSTKLARLRRVVLVFFANENFLVLDSAKYGRILSETTPADVVIDSKEAQELQSGDRVMYSVFASRDNFYGLVWLPSKKKFVKAWQN
ncbi:MAG TPA: hypothetical protein VFH43_07210, partial [Candidatus Kapabacteria bacterium]|nr:hypothetical protein [Candidatus Kapabacteria bacterium]